MIFEPIWMTLLKRTAVIVVLFGAWLWVSVDEYQVEQEEIAEAQLRIAEEQRRAELKNIELEDELPEYKEPEQQAQGWVTPSPAVKKRVAKIKRRVKRSI